MMAATRRGMNAVNGRKAGQSVNRLARRPVT
jgi:hypothetical protein